jgi:hypothetical protein
MEEDNMCKCKCGCTNKCKTYSIDDLTTLYSIKVEPYNAFSCENCLSGKHQLNNSENPLDTIKRQLANNEITHNEYYQLKSIIEKDEYHDF